MICVIIDIYAYSLIQRKVENLKKIKKAMLEKVFPKEDLT